MDNQYGIKISLPNTDVSKTGATVSNFTYPNIKLDTQNPVAFQNILLQITNDPPEPPVAGDKYTVVYQFPHSYDYIPSVETLFVIKSPAPGTVFYQQYFQDSGLVATQNVGSFATLYATADATNVYFIVDKTDTHAFGPAPNLLTGLTVQISCHVFLDDLGL